MGRYEPDVLPKSVAYDLVAVKRRRIVVSVLLDLADEVPLVDLATQVAAREDGVAESAVTEETHRAVAVSLRHHHLPTLDDASVVEFDSERNTVVSNDSLDDLEPLV
ncbi:hypothetical protein ACFPYI_11715 [Halomarina salina]|uniref:DUF7344 domain-containing protein n=1 Tax=Halomarina salina TaxID=1872699 RepID=A0ABD5RNV8_9EURY|nr:hypothetical protein [Halomarina salina]